MVHNNKSADEWSNFAHFLGEMIAKYAEVIDIDSLPDPHRYLQMKNMKEGYVKYLRLSKAYRKK